MKKFILPLLSIFLVSSLVGCKTNNTSNESSGGDTDSGEVDPRSNSLLPKDTNNPHKLELGEMSDYLDVIDVYNFDAVLNASKGISEAHIDSFCASNVFEDDTFVEDYYFYNDEFMVQDSDAYVTVNDESTKQFIPEHGVVGNIGDYFYRKAFDNDHNYYEYSFDSALEEGTNASSFFGDYLYLLESADGYLVTDEYIYLAVESMYEYGDRYNNINHNLTSTTYLYIELTKDLRFSASYSYQLELSDHDLDTGEYVEEGWVKGETATLLLAEYNGLTDYPKKQEFYNSFPEGLNKSVVVKFDFQNVTLNESNQITYFGSMGSKTYNPGRHRINESQGQVAFWHQYVGNNYEQFVVLRDIYVAVTYTVCRSDDPSLIGTTTTYEKTFTGCDTFAPYFHGEQIINQDGQDYFVIRSAALFDLIIIYDAFTLTPEITLNECHA